MGAGMNSKKCKQIRQIIYGDFSQRMKRSYIIIGHTVKRLITGKDGKPKQVSVVVNQPINHPEYPRGKYLIAKKLYKANRQHN
jgi:hypothetical protein